jgi:hypothetical protein
MDNRANRSIRLGVVLAVVVVACGLFLYLSFFSFPPTETIAQNYLDAIIHRDIEAVLKLGSSDFLCQNNLKNTALGDIDQFGGAVVQKVSISVHGPSGSRDEIQWASIAFEYRASGQAEWKHGEMIISTDHEAPGLRYTCGRG